MSKHALNVTKDSTARALRTAYQAAVGVIGFVPTLVVIWGFIPKDTPGYAQIAVAVAAVVTWSGIASKILNVLEERGIIPAPWKQITTTATAETGETNG